MAGAVLVILAVTIATVAADRRLPVIVAEGAQSFSSATWSALSLFRREAEERLRAKDAEIRSINAQLAELERRRDMLQQAMEATLLDLATELRTQTAGELELERVRLEGAGMPPEEIERRLAGFSEVLSARNRQALDGERMHEQSDLDAGLLAIKAQIDAARQKLDRAYALQDPKEYFAETTEAFFSTNDFYPFVNVELRKHDPEMFQLLRRLWGVEGSAGK